MKKFFFCFLVMASSAHVAADVARFNTSVTRVLVHSNYFGQCMAQVTEDIPSLLPNCLGGWVTFDCSAELPGSTRLNSSEKFNVAKTALLMEKSVYLEVVDNQTINGYCLAARIDMF